MKDLKYQSKEYQTFSIVLIEYRFKKILPIILLTRIKNVPLTRRGGGGGGDLGI